MSNFWNTKMFPCTTSHSLLNIITNIHHDGWGINFPLLRSNSVCGCPSHAVLPTFHAVCPQGPEKWMSESRMLGHEAFSGCWDRDARTRIYQGQWVINGGWNWTFMDVQGRSWQRCSLIWNNTLCDKVNKHFVVWLCIFPAVTFRTLLKTIATISKNTSLHQSPNTC